MVSEYHQEYRNKKLAEDPNYFRKISMKYKREKKPAFVPGPPARQAKVYITKAELIKLFNSGESFVRA